MFEVLIVLFVFYVVLCAINVYIIFSFTKVMKNYFPEKLILAEKKLNTIRLFGDYLSGNPKNIQTREIYNHTCFLLASIELLKGNDRAFLRELDGIKKENEFELKAFMLALYYRSKDKSDMAVKEYNKYIQCSKHEKDVQIIMSGLFDEKDSKHDDLFLNALNTFKNPAIIKLFIDNKLIPEYHDKCI